MLNRVVIGAIVIIAGLIVSFFAGKIAYDYIVKRKNELHAKEVLLTDNETVSEETLKKYFKNVPTYKSKSRYSTYYVNEYDQAFKQEDSDDVDSELKDKLNRNKGIIIL